MCIRPRLAIFALLAIASLNRIALSVPPVVDHGPATRSADAGAEKGAPTSNLAIPEPADLAAILKNEKATEAEKVKACQTLELMGPAAENASDALVVSLGDKVAVRLHAGRALVAIGKSAIPALRKAANLSSPEVQAAAAEAWARIDVSAGVPVGTFRDRVSQGSAGEKLQGRLALKEMGQQDAAVAGLQDVYQEAGKAALQKALHGSALEQVAALNRMYELGANVASLAPMVRPLLESPSEEVSNAAVGALHEMGTDAIPQLIDAMKSPDGHVRLLAAGAMKNPSLHTLFSDRGPAIVTALGKLLTDEKPEVAKTAAHSVCDYGLDSHAVLIDAIKAGNKIATAEVVEQMLTRPHGFTDGFMANKPAKGLPDSTPDWTAQKEKDWTAIKDREIELAKLVAPAIIERVKSEKTTDAVALRAMSCLPPEAVAKETVEIVGISVNNFKIGMSVGDATAPLVALGQAGLPALLEAADGKDNLLRSAAIGAIVLMPDLKPDPTIDKVVAAALSDPLDTTRRAAFHWAVSHRDPSPEIVERLARVLMNHRLRVVVAESRNENAPVNDIADSDRTAAVVLLGNYATKFAGTTLRILLRDESHEVRLSAIVALRSYPKEAMEALPELRKLTSADVPAEPTAATATLSDAAAAAETMLAAGKEGRKAAAPWYIRRLENDTDPTSLPETLHAIAIIGPDAGDAIPIMQKWLGSENNTLRVELADTLGEIGPSASATVPALVRMMDNSDFDIRQSASRALVKIVPDGKGLGPALMAAIYNRDRAAADRLAITFRQREDKKPLLARIDDMATNDTDAGVRATAHRAMELLKADPEPVQK